MPVTKEAVEKAKPKRKNNPAYVVFRLSSAHSEAATDGMMVEAWMTVLGRDEKGELVVTRAASRKAAVEAATLQAVQDGAPQDSKVGTFAVVPAAEFEPIKRKVRTEEVSEFE